MEPGPDPRLSTTDLVVLQVLVDNSHRVLGRESILRLAGLDSAVPRRCDSALVNVRKALGPDALRTVRKRGWILTDHGAGTAAMLLASLAAGTPFL